MIRHAGLVAALVGGAWRGVLIEGPSGAGKSDLALRCLDAGFRLVADDRVLLWVSGGRLFGRAPEALAGLVEARGLGILRIDPLPLCEVALVLRDGEAERLPDPQATDILGVAVPLLQLPLLQPSLPAKLRHALAPFDGPANRRI